MTRLGCRQREPGEHDSIAGPGAVDTHRRGRKGWFSGVENGIYGKKTIRYHSNLIIIYSLEEECKGNGTIIRKKEEMGMRGKTLKESLDKTKRNMV